MKAYNIIITNILLCFFVLNSCTNDFAELNTDPDAITEPDLGYMFANIANGFQERYSEYYFEHWQFISRFSQQYVHNNGFDITFSKFNTSTDRPDQFYYILRNTYDMRATIDAMSETDKAARQKMYYTTYIPEVYWGLRNTVFYGSMAFSEAMKAKEGKYSAKYDTQEELLKAWHTNLNKAIAEMEKSDPVTQINFNTGDFIFKNDWVKWAQTANALKYRMASYLINKDETWAKQLIQEVEASSSGLYKSATPEDQLLFMPSTSFMGTANDMATEFWAAENFVNFLKANNDPRLKVFFRPNLFSPASIDSMKKYGSAMPVILDYQNDPLYQYQGAPVSPDKQNLPQYWGYYGYKNTKLDVVSRLNRRLWSASFESGTGYMVEPTITYAEVCLLKAEFIKRGYITGNAEEWYNKGVRASLETFLYIADKAKLQDYTAYSEADILAYLSKPDVKLDGTNTDMEKIILQQYINFFRSPCPNWDLIRRTGFPAENSTIMKYTPMTSGGSALPVPRRSTFLKPSIQFMLEDWENAMKEQGFTPNVVDPVTLHDQRLWIDTANPDYGKGLN